MADLPDDYAKYLNNLSFKVACLPDRDQRRRLNQLGASLYGLYEGVPLPERGSHYGNVTPDRISIFWGPLARDFPEDHDLRREVWSTVYHEIAHHFGLAEIELKDTSVG